MTATSSPSIQPVIARQSDDPQQDKVTSSARGHVAGAFPKMYQERLSCSSNASADAIIAAKARRKRKELMKLKSQCYYQFH